MVEYSIKINGRTYKTAPMQNLRVFLEQNGIQNYGLCHNEKIISAAKCDLCLVEVNGELVRSCEVFVNTDMNVETKSDRTQYGLEQSFNLLALGHKTDCERCHQNGICKIQSFARTHNSELGSFELEANKIATEVTELGDNYFLDHDRCVNCTLCIDYSQKVAKDDIFFHNGRGSDQSVEFNHNAHDLDQLWRYRDLCPTGAIYHKDDLRIGERSKWVDVQCVGCDKACHLKARTISKRFIDVRNENIDELSCESGRQWWREIDLWRAQVDLSIRHDSGQMMPADLSELKAVTPKNMTWEVLLPMDLSAEEVGRWQQVVKSTRLSAKVLKSSASDLYFACGLSNPYSQTDHSFETIDEAASQYDGLIVVEPLWRYKLEFLQELKRRSRELVLFSSAPVIENLSLVQVKREVWPVSPLLPARQSEVLQGIIDILHSRD